MGERGGRGTDEFRTVVLLLTYLGVTFCARKRQNDDKFPPPQEQNISVWGREAFPRFPARHGSFASEKRMDS